MEQLFILNAAEKEFRLSYVSLGFQALPAVEDTMFIASHTVALQPLAIITVHVAILLPTMADFVIRLICSFMLKCR